MPTRYKTKLSLRRHKRHKTTRSNNSVGIDPSTVAVSATSGYMLAQEMYDENNL